ncbi:MAG: hypothetical protein ABI416_07415 [Ginsengibacter sp.]
MEELIQKLQSIHGLSADQSHGILNTITTFIKEKFPMVGGALDNFFPTGTPAASTAATAAAATEPVQDGGSFLDKISDFIPGSAGEKIEGFAKDKLGGLFGEDKKA